MRVSIAKKRFLFISGVGLFVFLWWLLALIIGKGTMVLPGPMAAFKQMVKYLASAYTYKCIFQSLARMLAGFGISFIAALILGLIAGNFPDLEYVFSPTITAFKTIPTASLVFLFIVLAGARIAPVYIVFVVAFPILYEGVTGGIKSVDREIVDASRVDGAGLLVENWRIRLPLAWPYIKVAVASSLSLSFKIEIMSEVITGTTYPGLGSAIATVRNIEPANMVPVFAYSLIAIILFILIDGVLKLLQREN